jgi:hypothetical protein
MASATDMVGELDDADKSSERDQYLNRRYRRAEAYEVLDGLLTTAIQKQQQVEKQLARFPRSLTQAREATSAVAGRGRQDLTNLPQPNSAPASVPGLFFSAAA